MVTSSTKAIRSSLWNNRKQEHITSGTLSGHTSVNFPAEVNIVEVGPRDGLQNEEKQVATDDKIKLIEALALAGLPKIEITSFVSPKWIPQLADGLEVAKRIHLPATTKTLALVPNMKGYASARE